MAGDEPIRRLAVALLAPALGQHEFLPSIQHGEPADFLKIPVETGFSCEKRRGRGTGRDIVLQVATTWISRRSHRRLN
jgi:hypothetical protein